MIVIGEKINISFKAVRNAIQQRDTAVIQELAKKQCEAGATYIDLNAGISCKDEAWRMEWLVNTVQEVADAPFSIDSPNMRTLEAGLKANRNPKPIINSITGEERRFQAVMPLILEYNTGVIALCMDDSGMPETVTDRVSIAERLIDRLTCGGVAAGDIYIDPMVRPVASHSRYGMASLETIYRVKKEFPGVHIACGLSNISFGIPQRKVMNHAFLIAAMTAGMDGAIMDPLDKKLMSLVYAGEALLGRDSFCMNYLMKCREGLLE